MSKKLLGDIGLLIVTIIWGSGFVATDIALEGSTTLQVMTYRFLVASILLLLIYRKSLSRINKSILIKGSILGVFLFLAFYFQTEGLNYTTPSKNAFITTMNIIFVPFLSFVFFKGKIDKYSIVGAILAFFGVSLLTVNFSDLTSSSINFGDFLTLLCAITFAMQIIFAGKFSKETNEPVLLSIVQMVVCTIFSLIAMVAFEGVSVANMTPTAIIAIVYLGIFSTAIGLTVQVACQMLTTETRAVILMSFEGVFGALFSVLLLGEVFTTQMIIGASIMFIAVMISQIPEFNFASKKQESNI